MSASSKYRNVGAIDFEATTLANAVQHTISDAVAGRNCHVHFANAWSIVLANENEELLEAFRCGSNYPDGMPVAWAMRWMRGGARYRKSARIDGPTFFESVLEGGVPEAVSHYFLGSTPETLNSLQFVAKSRFPGVEIVGTSSPPFRELTHEDLAHELDKIRATNPQIIWVGLGTPKQDLVAAYLSQHCPGIFACVGAAFDYTAGNLKVAPEWIQDAGLGWLYRLGQEPRRLWRRYLVGNAKFVRIVAMQAGRESVDRKFSEAE